MFKCSTGIWHCFHATFFGPWAPGAFGRLGEVSHGSAGCRGCLVEGLIFKLFLFSLGAILDLSSVLQARHFWSPAIPHGTIDICIRTALDIKQPSFETCYLLTNDPNISALLLNILNTQGHFNSFSKQQVALLALNPPEQKESTFVQRGVASG